MGGYGHIVGADHLIFDEVFVARSFLLEVERACKNVDDGVLLC